MTTIPLPHLPEPYQEALTPFWAYTADQMQTYATAARADLEAEVKRLREVLTCIGQYTGEGPVSTPWRDIVKTCGEKARAALENTK